MKKTLGSHSLLRWLPYWMTCLSVTFGLCLCAVSAESPTDTEQAIRSLQDSNRKLEQRVRDLEAENSDKDSRDRFALHSFAADNLILSGVGGLAFFSAEENGRFPEDEFRIDEGRLFLDVRLPGQLFAFVEVNLFEPDRGDDEVKIGEFYLEAEDVLRSLGLAGWASLRVGRFDIPFGEEYLRRDSIDNALITHSVSDIWGVDEGVEIFGYRGGLDYAFALQNGGHPSTTEGNSDKAVVGRIGFEPNEHVRISASAMRTGELDVEEDRFSEAWFGRGFLVPVSDPEQTTTFEGELYELDLILRRGRNQLAISGGRVDLSDDGGEFGGSTDATYYSVEAVHDLVGDLYGAVRYSGMESDDGFPVVGHAPFSRLFSPDRTESLWRLAAGLGYRLSAQAIVKIEYSVEEGETVGGADLDKRNMLSTGVSFAF